MREYNCPPAQICEDCTEPHFFESSGSTVPIDFAAPSQYLAMNVSLSERPRGLWVVQCTVTEEKVFEVVSYYILDLQPRYIQYSAPDDGS